ncbi:response regulator transcription factor [Saccharopolyspora elongata]|uniref:Response regulator transcription factor n=1 Tax=Saccharopolyspora elongata TaxID=2530387 RepID=A0A4V2YNU0_9PSEU|nr:response regulator transcription factor [Saccharopolyspora elongata]TDD55237.1 response regulator transcription factor [Saccharopolyspora elongata]
MARVLLVEDDDALAEALSLALGSLGHSVEVAATGERALALLSEGHATDVVLLDVMLPGIDGFEVCRRIRIASTVPLILLTARGDAIDVVVGLEGGADDYVVKPTEPRIIDARIKAVLRRSMPPDANTDPCLRFGPLEIDPLSLVVTRDGQELHLTATELRLLLEFADRPGQVLSRQVLLRQVWDYGYVGDSRIVDAAVARLRAKIEEDAGNPVLLRTVRGLGYRLVKP